MCEFATHCRSLPSEACGSLQSPIGCSATRPSLQILPASLGTVEFQRSVWLLNAFGLKDILHPNLSVYCLYLYSGSSLSLLEDRIFAEWSTGWCRFSKWSQKRTHGTSSLIKTALSYKVKLLWPGINIKSWILYVGHFFCSNNIKFLQRGYVFCCLNLRQKKSNLLSHKDRQCC